MTMNVAVLGMGPAGLVTVKELKEAGLNVTGFDRFGRIGGRWSLDATEMGIWKELCMTETRRTTEFSDFAWECGCYDGHEKAYKGHFPHSTEVFAYLDAYTKHFDLYQHIVLETEVKSLELLDDDNTWSLVSQSKNGAQTTQNFDALVVCSGRHAKAKHPLQETTFRNYTGDVIHSHKFGSMEDYKGKRVLVVGSSVSGGEIADGLATEGGCKSVVNSVRHVPYHVEKISRLTKKPINYILFTRLPAWLGRFLPDSITSKGLKATVLENFPDQLTEETAFAKPDPDVRKAGICLSVNYMANVKEGNLKIKPAVASAQGSKVTFQDGSTEEFDVVICATGYECDLSFLPPKVQEKVCYTSPFTGASEVALYKNTLVPRMDNLAFVGLLNNIGSHMTMSEMQARYVAATFSGKVPRPSDAQLEAGVSDFKRFRQAGPHNAMDFVSSLCEDIGDELGVTPSYFQGIWNAKTLLFGPLYSCNYRTHAKVEGDERARRCRAVFERYCADPEL